MTNDRLGHTLHYPSGNGGRCWRRVYVGSDLWIVDIEHLVAAVWSTERVLGSTKMSEWHWDEQCQR